MVTNGLKCIYFDAKSTVKEPGSAFGTMMLSPLQKCGCERDTPMFWGFNITLRLRERQKLWKNYTTNQRDCHGSTQRA